VQGDVSGLSTLVLAMGIGLALAAGVVLGEFLAQPVRSRLGRIERRLRTPADNRTNPLFQRNIVTLERQGIGDFLDLARLPLPGREKGPGDGRHSGVAPSAGRA